MNLVNQVLMIRTRKTEEVHDSITKEELKNAIETAACPMVVDCAPVPGYGKHDQGYAYSDGC